MGCTSFQRSFGPVLHLTFLNVTGAMSFPQVFPVHYPALMDGLHHMPRFGGVPTHIARAKLNGVCFLPVLIDFSIVPRSLILPNKNQIAFDFENSFLRTHPSIREPSYHSWSGGKRMRRSREK
jgi:hypothetical protein